jgi:hypothetical protein
LAKAYDLVIGGDGMIDWLDRIERSEDAVVIQPPPVAGTNDSDLIDEFIEFFNARDLDSIESMLAADVEAEFVHSIGSVGALIGLEDLFLREPLVLLTRGDADGDALAVVWHPSETGHHTVGYLAFEFTDEDPGEITRIEYLDELNAEDLVVEEPDEVMAEEWELEET